MQDATSKVWELIAQDSGHALIEASAGTGKTYTVARLVVELLASGRYELDDIVVMSFTRLATAELEARILKFLHEALEQARDGGKYFEAALRRVGSASICTIDSFTQGVLRGNVDVTHFPSRFELINDKSLHHEAFARFLRAHVKDPAFAQVLAYYHDGTYKSEAYKAMRQDLELWCDLDGELFPKPFDDSAAVALYKELIDLALRMREKDMLEAYSQFLAQVNLGKESKNIKKFVSLLYAARYVEVPDYGDLGKAFSGSLGKDLTRKPKELRECSPWEQAVVDKLEAMRHSPRPMSKQLKLSGYLTDYVAQYRALKEERTKYEYSDFLRIVELCLTDARDSSLLSRLKKQYKLVIVDEFQDSNARQWSVFSKIFMTPGDPHRLIIVGDPKQSIYGFRGGDVHTYLAAREQITAQGGTLYALKRNYRSTPAILAFFNSLYTHEAGKELFDGAIRYEEVSAGRELRYIDATGQEILDFRPVRLLDIVDEKLSVDKARGLLRSAIVREILSLRAMCCAVCDQEGARSELGNDILILCATNDEVIEMSKALSAAGIVHTTSDMRGLFYKKKQGFRGNQYLPSEEAEQFLWLLRAIAQPQEMLARRAAWNTPFFMHPMQELARLPRDENQPLSAAFLRWSFLAASKQYAVMFNEILAQTVFHKDRIAFFEPETLERYQAIAQRLASLAQRERYSLGQLIQSLEAFTRNEDLPENYNIVSSSSSSKVDSSSKVVRLMTLHKSKGLEAQCVFLNLVGDRKNARYPRRFYEGGKLVHCIEANAEYDDLCDKEEQQENQRLAYVALTRAASVLYLPRFKKDKSCISPHVRSLAENAQAMQFVEVIELSTEPESSTVPLPEAAGRDFVAFEALAYPCIEHLQRSAKPLVFSSYSAIKRQEGTSPKSRKHPPMPKHKRSALAGGAQTGLFLHDILQFMPFDWVSRVKASGLDAASLLDASHWPDDRVRLAAMQKRINDIQQRYAISDEGCAEALEMVFGVLTHPVPQIAPHGLCTLAQHSKELPFLYRIPEPENSTSPESDSSARAKRGYIQGSIDLVFGSQGKYYLLDWKSDAVQGYSHAALKTYVRENYAWQISVYGYALAQMLRITQQEEFNQKFGGVIYAFLRQYRANSSQNPFVFFHTTFQDIQTYKMALIEHDYWAKAPQKAVSAW